MVGRDLTELARIGVLTSDGLLFAERRRLLRILNQRQRNHALIVAHQGAGVTTLLNGLARTLARLDGSFRLVEVEAQALESGRLLKTIAQSEQSGLVVAIRGADLRSTATVGLMREIIDGTAARLIASASREQAAAVMGYPLFASNFSVVQLKEPTAEETVSQLLTTKELLERHHSVEIQPSAVREAVRIAQTHIKDQALPGSALTLLDAAAAYARMPSTAIVDEGKMVEGVVDADVVKHVFEQTPRLDELNVRRPQQWPFDAFLCYSSQDDSAVRHLYQRLAGAGYRVWVDWEEMRPGDVVTEVLEQAMARSRFLLACLSNGFLSSEWVRHEVRTTLHEQVVRAQKRLIPLLIGEVDRDAIPPFLRSLRMEDVRTEAGMVAVLRLLEENRVIAEAGR
jgi:hypothetical protein